MTTAVSRIIAATLAFAAVSVGPATAVRAAGDDLWSLGCAQLWYERNAIYKGHGYCFRTDRAINTFGNQGCYATRESELDLSSREQNRIALIQLIERQKFCPR